MRSDCPVCSGRSAAGFEKKRPAPTARTYVLTKKCELAAGRWPLATGYLAGAAAAAAAIAVAALGATFPAALAAASAAAALS